MLSILCSLPGSFLLPFCIPTPFVEFRQQNYLRLSQPGVEIVGYG